MIFNGTQIIEIYEALFHLSQMKLPYGIGINLRKFRKPYDELMEEKRLLIDTHAEKDKDGNNFAPVPGQVKIKDDKKKEFNDTWKKLCTQEYEVQPFPLSQESFVSFPGGLPAGSEFHISFLIGSVIPE